MKIHTKRRPGDSADITRILGMALTALVSASIAIAGFDFPKDVPDAAKSYDGEVFGRDGTFPAATIAKLRTTFTLSEADAKTKLTAMRKNIKKAIELVKAQDATIGRCLEDAINCERMCLDFKSKDAQASCLPDGTTECRKDPINIGVKTVPCTEVTAYSPELYPMCTNLLHEGKHAVQSYDPGALDPNPLKAKVQIRKKAACNEIEAEQLENVVNDAIKPALQQIAAGGNPASPAGAAGRIIDAIKALPTAAERMAAANALLVVVNKLKAFSDQHITCRNAQKVAFDAFLTSAGAQADLDTMNMAIRNTRWYAVHGFKDSFDIVSKPIFFGGGGGGLFSQYDGVTLITTDTGLANTTDMQVLKGGDRAIVAGNDSAGNGVLMAYSDTDGDGFLDSSSTLVVSSLLRGGLDIVLLRSGAGLFVFPSESSLVYEVIDTDNDGLPETLDTTPRVASSALLSDIVFLIPSDDGRTLYGSREGDIEDTTLTKTESQIVLRDLDGNGFFETIFEQDLFAGALFTPNFVGEPVIGQTSAALYAAASANVEVHRVDAAGTSLGLLATTAVDAAGDGSVIFSSPLVAGDLVQVRDVTNGASSLPNVVGPIAQAFCFGDGTGTACPCGNMGSQGNGCGNSVNRGGANLSGSGAASVAADAFVLSGSGMPGTSSCLYFQGTLQENGGLGTVFGDGLRCAAGSVVRLGSHINAGGSSQYPASGDAPISVQGMIPSGGATRVYQAWYRNIASFCTSDPFNLSNGLELAWAP